MGSEQAEHNTEFIPGKLSSATLENKAKRANLTLAQAVEMRYEAASKMLAGRGVSRAQATELREEMNAIGTPAGATGSSARSAWFRNWEERLPQTMTSGESDIDLIRSLMATGALGEGLGSVGLPTGTSGAPKRRVRVPDVKTLQKAVKENAALNWDPRMSELAGAEGDVMVDDPS